jgi:hypothetical protein
VLPTVVNGDNDPKKRQQAQNEDDFPATDTSRCNVPGAGSCRAFIEFNGAPEDENERPPVGEHMPDAEAAIVVK